MSAKIRWLRIRRRITQQEQTSEIADFLSWCTPEELWFLVPVIFTILPESIQRDYHFFDSESGLAILYDSPNFNCNFIPAVAILLARWRTLQPAQCAYTLAEATAFLRDQRSRTHGDAV